MIQTSLRLTSPPQRTAELVQAFRSLMRSARAEKGFITCGLYLEADNANTVCYEERWETREDMERQLRSPRYTCVLALMESASKPPTLEFLFVSEMRGLEYIANVRGED